ncbi:MAG: type II toxin-antitoxin system VapC family toxin [Nitrospirae bacterium]|nr:type II toxin-antitoxin system VapC family toxin [Nitrospirota bacterium]
MRKRNLLDSFAILALLKKENNYQAVREILKEARNGERALIMNQVNAGEVYYEVLKRNLTDDFDKFWKTFLMLPIEFIANDFELVIEAAKIKSRYAISYADCFAVAAAIKEDAVIVTGDPEFKKVEKLARVQWL